MTIDARIIRTRESAAAAVKAILAEEGWEAVTHVRVARRSGLSRATVYTHWPDRLALLRDALADMALEAEVPLTGDLRADLLAVLKIVVVHLKQDGDSRALIALVERAEWEQRLNRLKTELVDEPAAVVRRILAAAADSGELRAGLDLHRGVSQLIGPLIWRRYMSGEPISTEFLEAIVHDFIEGHRPADAPAG
jgi:AcrR family transcriptional regulator